MTLGSSRTIRTKPAICRITITVNGIAPVIAMALATATLPVARVATVMAVMMMPQVSLVLVAGFRLPLLVIMLMTKVPESALVTRKMKIRQTERKLRKVEAGKYSRNANRAEETSANTCSASPPAPNISI